MRNSCQFKAIRTEGGSVSLCVRLAQVSVITEIISVNRKLSCNEDTLIQRFCSNLNVPFSEEITAKEIKFITIQSHKTGPIGKQKLNESTHKKK